MRTAYRVGAAALGLLAALPLGMPSAAGESSTEPAAIGGWFWSAQVSGPAGGGVVPGAPGYPAQLPATQLAAPGNMVVSKVNPTEPSAAEAYLSWDLTTVPLDATIKGFSITVPLDPEGHQFAEGGVALIACAPKAGWGPGDGDAYASKPENDCSNAAVGVFDEATQAWKFDVTEFAQTWLTADNFGIAIVPAADQQAPFQVVFKSAANAQAAIEFEALPVIQLPPTDLPPATDPGLGTSGGTVTDPGLGLPVDTTSVAPAVPAPVAPAQNTPRAANRVSTQADLAPTAEFWIAVLALLFVLGMTSLVLGDSNAVQAGAGQESRFSRALRERQRARTSGVGHPRPV